MNSYFVKNNYFLECRSKFGLQYEEKFYMRFVYLYVRPSNFLCLELCRYTIILVYQKAFIRIFYTNFLTTQLTLRVHNARTQIKKMILYSKTGFRSSL